MKPVRKYGVDDPDGYWRDRVAAGRNREHRIHRFLAELIREKFPGGGKVLDCGVGDGHVFRICRRHFETYGVEFSQEAISRYEFPVDTIKRADLNGGIPDFGVRFDAIVVSNVLHWLDDPENFLRQAARHLTPRGRLLIVVPNITNYHYRMRFLFGQFPKISLSHKNVMTPPEVEETISRAGLEIEKLASSKKSLRHKFWPRLFATGLVYVLKPLPSARQ